MPGTGGVKRMFKIKMTADENARFQKTVDPVKGLVVACRATAASPAWDGRAFKHEKDGRENPAVFFLSNGAQARVLRRRAAPKPIIPTAPSNNGAAAGTGTEATAVIAPT